MEPAQSLSLENENQLPGSLKAYYPEPGFSLGHIDTERDSEEQQLYSIGLGMTVLYYIIISLFLYGDSSLWPWIALLGPLAVATSVGMVLVIMGAAQRWRNIRTATKVLGASFIILATLVWNIAAYGLVAGMVGASFVLAVTFLALLWTMAR
jgi:O-antigen/teichoic acid export membrane protein